MKPFLVTFVIWFAGAFLWWTAAHDPLAWYGSWRWLKPKARSQRVKDVASSLAFSALAIMVTVILISHR